MEASLNIAVANESAVVAVKLESPPIGFSTANASPVGVLQSLLAGDELQLMGTPLSSTFQIAAKSTGQTAVSKRGGWVYVDTLSVPNNTIFGSQVALVVDQACYSKWFATAQFDADGNPSESAVHSCETNDVELPPASPAGGALDGLVAIRLSDSVLFKGSNSAIQITPTPSTIALSGCTALSMDGSITPLVNVAGNLVRVTSSASSIGIDTPLLIQCGTANASLTLLASQPLTAITLSASSLPKGSAASVTINPVPGNAALPPCTALNGFGGTSFLVKVSGNQLSLDSNSSTVNSSTALTIRCGTATAAFSIVVATAPTLTGLTLSSSTIAQGSVGSVSIAPLPSNAVLPSCSVLSSTGSALLRISGNTVSLTEASGSLTSNTTVTISCGGIASPLTITVPATTTTVDASGNLVIHYTLRPRATDVGKSGRVVIGLLSPAIPLFKQADNWYFLTSGGWRSFLLMDVVSLDSLSYQAFPRLNETVELVLPLGVSKRDANALGVMLYVGYYTGDGVFKNLGKFYPND
jgi:hypothetical protein